VSTSLYFIELWIPIFMLGYFATAEAVGIFSAVYRTALLVQGILLSFNTIFAPIISDLHHRREDSKLESLLKVVTKWAFSLSLPALLLLIAFSQEVLGFFGSGFVVGAASLIVLSIGQLVNSVTGSLGLMINMSGRSKITLLNSTLHLLLQAGLCLLLIPKHGILGAALASAISTVFLNAIQLLQVYFVLGMHPFRIEFLKPVAAGGGAWLVLSLARASILQTDNSVLLLVLGFSIFLAVYGLALCGLGFDEEDKAVLQRIRARLA
jgi:O-antigen/teichoic acid export membrane protein